MHISNFTGAPGISVFVYARHSQSAYLPNCPTGHTEMWQGYSLLHAEDGSRSNVMDLGMVVFLLCTHTMLPPSPPPPLHIYW